MNERIESELIKCLKDATAHWTNVFLLKEDDAMIHINVALRQAETSSAPSLPLTHSMLHQSTHEHTQIACSLQHPIFINTIIDMDMDVDTNEFYKTNLG